jgi:hypothetical protein
MDTKEKIEVMQAYLDGKQIEARGKPAKATHTWTPLHNTPTWDWLRTDYRVKKEPAVAWGVVSDKAELLSVHKRVAEALIASIGGTVVKLVEVISDEN